jgi:hypothetical protein
LRDCARRLARDPARIASALVLTLARHRPAIETSGPDDQRAAIVALLERINLTPDRAAGLHGTLTSWLELDREERRR